ELCIGGVCDAPSGKSRQGAATTDGNGARVVTYNGQRMMSLRSKCVRRISGALCLTAALFLLMPQVILAWWTATGACCRSNYCPIPGHHPSPKAPASTEHDGMECEHGAPGLAACTMSCCHDKKNALMAPATFVLERAPALPITVLVSPLIQSPASN